MVMGKRTGRGAKGGVMWFRRPRRLTRREAKALAWALETAPPKMRTSLLSHMQDIRVQGRCACGPECIAGKSDVRSLYFNRDDREPIEASWSREGRKVSEPVWVVIYAGKARHRLREVEIVANSSGRPPVIVEVD